MDFPNRALKGIKEKSGCSDGVDRRRDLYQGLKKRTGWYSKEENSFELKTFTKNLSDLIFIAMNKYNLIQLQVTYSLNYCRLDTPMYLNECDNSATITGKELAVDQNK